MIRGAALTLLLIGLAGYPANAAAFEDHRAQATAPAAYWEVPVRPVRRARTRIEIRPGPLYHRECVDGLRPVSNKYVGRTVLMPYMRCWWVRG